MKCVAVPLKPIVVYKASTIYPPHQCGCNRGEVGVQPSNFHTFFSKLSRARAVGERGDTAMDLDGALPVFTYMKFLQQRVCVYPLLRLGYCIRYNRVAACSILYICIHADWLALCSLARRLGSFSLSLSHPPAHSEDIYTRKAFDLSPVHGSPHLRMQIQFYFSQNMNY